ASGCIGLDFFLFDPEQASSIEEDYHGLPLWNGDGAPQWVLDAEVEREIYLRVPSAEVLSPGALDGEGSYLHGVFLHAPATCPVAQCPLIEVPPTFIYQHGNSGHMWRYWWRAVALWSLGADVFIYTYRGYGLSKGEPTTGNVLADAATAIAYVSARPDVDPQRIVAYGYSMGGVPASYLVGASAYKQVFAACILEASLDSPETIVEVATGTDFPGGFFLDEDSPFDGPDFIKGSALPILHMHGGADDVLSLGGAEHYYQVLESRPDYTHYLGKTDKPDEVWIKACKHRNVPAWSWAAAQHIADYWGSEDNPHHCCVHPLEYPDPVNAGFLAAIGDTTGDELLAASLDYRRLLADWLLVNLP
ncbi:MAG TPA: alpha/beta hydrolase, partial [Polyangia bacterium]|nr:alpha/beta hydrolase [Polyangia bacterium]